MSWEMNDSLVLCVFSVFKKMTWVTYKTYLGNICLNANMFLQHLICSFYPSLQITFSVENSDSQFNTIEMY